LKDWLGVGAFMKGDQVSVWVKNGKLLRSPWFARERSIRMNYGMTRALRMEAFDSLNLHSATCGFSDVTIFAGPEVDFDRSIGNHAVLALRYVNLREAKLRREELGTSLNIERCEDGRGSDKLDLCTHGCAM
jgi:hypothetical protein